MKLKYCLFIFLTGLILIFTACPGMPADSSASRALAESSARENTGESTEEPPVFHLLEDSAQNLTEAVLFSSRIISESLDSGTRIAVISINADNVFESEYVLEELTFNLVRLQKFIVVDRHNLDVIRAEQQLHISGDVSDETAVSIGHLIGAAYVITGNISSREQIQRENYLRIRVLDVQTGQIHVMSSVLYGGIR